jgi:hypothetical protein
MVSYSGAVTPGGSPDTRKLGSLTITKVAVDEQMSNNAYLLRCHGTGEQVLIDAAAEPERLLPLVGDAGLTTVVPTPTRSRPRPAYPSPDASSTATPSRSATAPSR